MHNFGTIFLWALACIQWQGSFAKDQSGYICLIEDPKQNECDSICLTELRPRLNEVVKAQNQGNTITRNSDNEIKSKLEALEVKIGEVQAKLEGVENKLKEQLHGVEAKLQGQQVVLTKVENFQAKLDKSLHAVEKRLENKLEGVLKKIETELQAVLININAAKMEIPDRISNNIPFGFELIGSRYFRIVADEYANWNTAERKCREMGAYLASFRNEEEFNAIQTKLKTNVPYWLGINDHGNEGHFVSVASHKPPLFLKWREGQPSDQNREENCVILKNGEMLDILCGHANSFICQADNET